ncbi:hypothetical protein CRI94_00240 [Longibacter salinarum]|uniref:Uncharacterized protein n=1 Tax=Longibacter salinarum TaxID=1850348 RepID=A0A2A8D1C2_9BACT|nr:hypothetical protein [Longibacter salinarum]PEN14762.1 hypothetical protein CRI94_00240 [Longibacter salinarum]
MSRLDAEESKRVERLQTCAREFVRLLHDMPVSSTRKQTAIRLLIKAVRLVTPDPSASSGLDSDLGSPDTSDEGSGIQSLGSSNGVVQKSSPSSSPQKAVRSAVAQM